MASDLAHQGDARDPHRLGFVTERGRGDTTGRGAQTEATTHVEAPSGQNVGCDGVERGAGGGSAMSRPVRSWMRRCRGPVLELEGQIIHVTPVPILTGFVGPHHGMSDGPEMPRWRDGPGSCRSNPRDHRSDRRGDGPNPADRLRCSPRIPSRRGSGSMIWSTWVHAGLAHGSLQNSEGDRASRVHRGRPVPGGVDVLMVKHCRASSAVGSVPPARRLAQPVIGNDPCCQPIVPGEPGPRRGRGGQGGRYT